MSGINFVKYKEENRSSKNAELKVNGDKNTPHLRDVLGVNRFSVLDDEGANDKQSINNPSSKPKSQG